MEVTGVARGWACSAPWARWVLFLLPQMALGTLSAFRASVNFLADPDIHSSLALRPCLSRIPFCLPHSCFPLPSALIGFRPWQDPHAIPRPAALLRDHPITEWDLTLSAPFSHWLTYPLRGKGGEQRAACLVTLGSTWSPVSCLTQLPRSSSYASISLIFIL